MDAEGGATAEEATVADVAHLPEESPRAAAAAMDFFVIPSASFRLLYGLVVLEHCRRRIRHVAVTIDDFNPSEREGLEDVSAPHDRFWTVKKKDALAIEWTGPDASPEAIDSRALFEFAGAYLALLESIAKVQERGELRHQGVAIADKCIEVRVTPSDLLLAEAVAVEAHRCIKGVFHPPRGTRSYLETVQRHLRANEKQGRHIQVKVADWSGTLEAPIERPQQSPFALVTLRVEVLEVGGEGDARVRLRSKSEPESFQLAATKDQCLKLCELGLLYGWVDAEMRIVREAQGLIQKGELLHFDPIPAAAPGDAAAFLAWVERAGDGWENEEDPLEELGRGGLLGD